MQPTIKEIGPQTHALEIKASADELTDDVSRAIRKVRSGLRMNGFRPGKVPQSLVRTLHRTAIEDELKSTVVSEVYEDLVDNAPNFSVCVGPEIETLEYTLDGDLHAVVKFGVRPEIELRELDGEVLETMAHTVTEEEIESELTTLGEQGQVYVPREDSGIEETDYVVYHRKEVDADTGLPLIGGTDLNETLVLDADYMQTDPDASALGDAVLGARVGETVRYEYEPEEEEGLLVTETDRRKTYEVDILEVRRPELPEMDDAFAFDASNGKAETMDALRDMIRNSLEARWAKKCLEYRNQKIVDKMLELHPFPIPEMLLDEIVKRMMEMEDIDAVEEPDAEPDHSFFIEGHARDMADRSIRWRFLLRALADAHEDSLKKILEEVLEELREPDKTTGAPNMESAVFRVFGMQAPQGGSPDDQDSTTEGLLMEFLSRQFDHAAKDSATIEQEEDRGRILVPEF